MWWINLEQGFFKLYMYNEKIRNNLLTIKEWILTAAHCFCNLPNNCSDSSPTTTSVKESQERDFFDNYFSKVI